MLSCRRPRLKDGDREARASERTRWRRWRRSSSRGEAEEIASTAKELGIDGPRDRSVLYWMALSCFIVGFVGIVFSALFWTAHGNVPFVIFGAFVLSGARLLLRSWKHERQRDSD